MNPKDKLATENTEHTESAFGFLCDLCVLCGRKGFAR